MNVCASLAAEMNFSVSPSRGVSGKRFQLKKVWFAAAASSSKRVALCLTALLSLSTLKALCLFASTNSAERLLTPLTHAPLFPRFPPASPLSLRDALCSASQKPGAALKDRRRGGGLGGASSVGASESAPVSADAVGVSSFAFQTSAAFNPPGRGPSPCASKTPQEKGANVLAGRDETVSAPPPPKEERSKLQPFNAEHRGGAALLQKGAESLRVFARAFVRHVKIRLAISLCVFALRETLGLSSCLPVAAKGVLLTAAGASAAALWSRRRKALLAKLRGVAEPALRCTDSSGPAELPAGEPSLSFLKSPRAGCPLRTRASGGEVAFLRRTRRNQQAGEVGEVAALSAVESTAARLKKEELSGLRLALGCALLFGLWRIWKTYR